MLEKDIKLVETMMSLQRQFNDKLRSDWAENPPEYIDAMWTEATKAFNHTNWPWWKKSGEALDIYQIQMEVVDVWHFLLSEIMTFSVETDGNSHLDFVRESDDVFRTKVPTDYKFDVETVRERLKLFISTCLMKKGPDRLVANMFSFLHVMFGVDLTWEKLYKMYVGKNTLNRFRQVNGYKTNTAEYLAQWATEKGWEDNQYLEEILNKLNIEDLSVEDFQLKVLNELLNIFTNLSTLKKAA